MRIVIPDPKSMYVNHPVNRRDRCVKFLSGVPGGPGPIQPRQAKPGNISMHDHLQSVKSQAESDLDVVIDWSGI